jgi:HK97 family phage portal protein
MKDVSIQPQIDAFWDQLWGTTAVYSPRLVDRVWAANRCLQLVCDGISSMPLRFTGTREPAWVTNPDPNWYPNGISSALSAAVRDLYVYGDAFLYVTDQYADGFPAGWTVLNASAVSVNVDAGRRVYRDQQVQLQPDRVVQITRNPRSDSVRGTPALGAYADALWGSVAAGELGKAMVGVGGSVPNAVLKSSRKLTGDQAVAIQEQWVAARQRSGAGVPAVLPPELELQQLSFSPTDMLLTDLQQYYARVIAAAFGVPPFLVNMALEGGLTYQNPQMLIEQWWRGELRPRAEQIASALSAQMLPRGSAVEFDSREALAPAWQDLVAGSLAMVNANVMTADEFRAAVLHLPPMGEGDALDELTMPPTAAATPAQQPSAIVQELRPTTMVAV